MTLRTPLRLAALAAVFVALTVAALHFARGPSAGPLAPASSALPVPPLPSDAKAVARLVCQERGNRLFVKRCQQECQRRAVGSQPEALTCVRQCGTQPELALFVQACAERAGR